MESLELQIDTNLFQTRKKNMKMSVFCYISLQNYPALTGHRKCIATEGLTLLLIAQLQSRKKENLSIKPSFENYVTVHHKLWNSIIFG